MSEQNPYAYERGEYIDIILSGGEAFVKEQQDFWRYAA